MKFQPLIEWWLVVPLTIAGLGFIGWYVFQIYKKYKKLPVMWIRRAVLLLFMMLAALGPSVPGGTSSPGVANLDILFAVDTTASMGAQDYNGTKLRLEGIKQDLLALSTKLKGAHFSIVTFDSKANVLLPFTSDAGTFSAAVQAIHREIKGTSKGSAIDKPLELITQQLSNSKAEHPERGRLLFFMSDGEQTNNEEVKSFKDAAKDLDGGAVLGYGTPEGAKMLAYDGLSESTGDAVYVNMLDPATKKFVPATSKLDEEALKKIAEDLKITYENRNNGGNVDALYKSSNAEVLIDQSKKITHYLNLYWLFAIPVGGLLFWEWKQILLLWLELRRQKKGQDVKTTV